MMVNTAQNLFATELLSVLSISKVPSYFPNLLHPDQVTVWLKIATAIHTVPSRQFLAHRTIILEPIFFYRFAPC
jgi:hypothetical protein